MPSSRKIASNWFLLGESVGPLAALETDVCAVLENAGEIPAVEMGFHAREAEWVANREWTFETRFDCPEGEDERLRLRFGHIYGPHVVRLNDGEPIVPVAGAYELTADLREGENCLRVIFRPEPHLYVRRCAPRIGFSGARLEGYSYVRVENWDVEAGVSRLSLEAFVGGRYQFTYTVSREGALIARTQVQERLPAARRQIAHEFDMGSADGESVEVLLTIERGGVGCDAMRAWVLPYSGETPLRLVEGPCHPATLARLGAQAAVGRFSAREKSKLARAGVAALLPEEREEGFARVAMAAPEECLRHAEGHPFWPQGCALLKSRHTPAMDLKEYQALFSRTVGEEPERFARLTRYAQAECVAFAAREARERGARFLAAKAFDEEFAYASAALVEANGACRPAFWALRDAWKSVHAFLRMDLWQRVEPEEAVSLEAVLLRDTPLGTLHLRCEAYGMQGESIARSAIEEEGGSFSFAAPGEASVILLRTIAEDAYGRLVSRCDQLLCVESGERPMAPLWNPPRTRLAQRDGLLLNEGPSVALCVCAEGYYGALLPGESIRLEKGGAFECLNAIL